MNKTKAFIFALRNDAEFKRLNKKNKGMERSIAETDTETIPSKHQRRVTSLAADYEEEFKICGAQIDKKVELKREYFAIIDQMLSKIDCRYGQSDIKKFGHP